MSECCMNHVLQSFDTSKQDIFSVHVVGWPHWARISDWALFARGTPLARFTRNARMSGKTCWALVASGAFLAKF